MYLPEMEISRIKRTQFVADIHFTHEMSLDFEIIVHILAHNACSQHKVEDKICKCIDKVHVQLIH
jgi:hypothetical protein